MMELGSSACLIRLIKATVDGAATHGIWTGVCGEMAGDLELLPLLVGLGVDELSVGTQQVPLVKRAVRSLNHADCVTLAGKALQAGDSASILDLCHQAAESAYPELLEQIGR